MRSYLIAISALLLPICAHAQSIVNRHTTTTVDPGAAADFSSASYTYANTVTLDSTAGTASQGTLMIQPGAMNIVLAGFGGTTITPMSVANGTSSTNLTVMSPGGSGQGFTFGYNGGADGFLMPSIVNGHYALDFNGGGVNLAGTGDTFDSTVDILGDFSAASAHTAATYGAGYTVLQNFSFNGTDTVFEVETTDFQGVNPTIGFSLLGGAVAPVPEPATWAMMIAGFGVVGAAMRRRQKTAFSFA